MQTLNPVIPRAAQHAGGCLRAHTTASALQSLGMALPWFVSGMNAQEQLHCAKTEALNYQQVRAARAKRCK